MIDYVLKAPASGPVFIEILDAAGATVRRYASTDPVERPDASTAPVPLYWYRPPMVVGTTAGMHRFTWDLHYQPVPGGGGRGGGGGLPIAAVPFDTVSPPNAPWVMPGTYTVKLTVDGRTYAQPLTVRMDPRVKTPASALVLQFSLSKKLYDGALEAQAALQQVRNVRAQVKLAAGKAGQSAVSKTLSAFDAKAAALEGTAGGGFGGGGAQAGGGAVESLAGIGSSLTSLMALLQGADAAPTSQAMAAVGDRRRALADLLDRWAALKTADLGALNAQLKAAGLAEIALR
jgi:hypothetical protein